MKVSLDFSKYKGITRLRDWWRQVKGNLEALQKTINFNDGLLSDEATARRNSDVDIAGSVSVIASQLQTEIRDRAAGDSELASDIEKEASLRAREDAKLQNQISDITAQSSLYDLYGYPTMIHKAELSWVWMDTNDYTYSAKSESEDGPTAVDISGVWGDVELQVDELTKYDEASGNTRGWNVSYKFNCSATHGEVPLLICFDVVQRRVWCELDYSEGAQGNRYENGAWKFEVGTVEESTVYSDDGDGMYDISVSIDFYSSTAEHPKRTAEYEGQRTTDQLKTAADEADDFLDAVNYLYERIKETSSECEDIKNTLGTMSAMLDALNGE